jgi:hypothetical protein
MKTLLRLFVLRVAWLVYGQSHGRVVNGIGRGTCKEVRPLAYFPDWWVGFTTLYPPGPNTIPEIRRIYAAACFEWERRQTIAAEFARAALLLQSAVDHHAAGLFTRWHIEVDTFPGGGPWDIVEQRWVTVPNGAVFISDGYIEYGAKRLLVMDVPAGEKVVVHSQRVRAKVIDLGMAPARPINGHLGDGHGNE